MVGDQEGHLFAVVDRLECGANGHLGLAVAHVAADQAVHRPVGLHIALDRVDGMQLVVGLLVGEGGLHLFLPRAVRAVDMALDQLALGVELEQVVGDLGHGALGALLDHLPVGRAQPRDRRRALAGAHVAAQAVGLMHRHIELVARAHS